MHLLGQPIPLQVGYAGSPPYVGVILYNVTVLGSPVVVGSPIPLTNVAGSINWYGVVTPPAVGAYSVDYSVFTDNTYTTRTDGNGSWSEDSEGFQVVSPGMLVKIPVATINLQGKMMSPQTIQANIQSPQQIVGLITEIQVTGLITEITIGTC